MISEKVTNTEDLRAIGSAFIGSVGVCKSVLNYIKTSEK